MVRCSSADTSRSSRATRPRPARFDVAVVLVLALLPTVLSGTLLWRAREPFGAGPPGSSVPGVEGRWLSEERGIAPDAWPAEDADLAGPPPSRYPSPQGWSATLEESSPHRRIYSLTNSGRSTWMAVRQPYHPGWQAFALTGEELAVRPAYGFLTAVRVPEGRLAVRLEYRPWSFAWGWVCFLWAAWVWLAVAVAVWGRPARSDGEALWHAVVPSALAGLVVVLVLARAHRLFDSVSDSLVLRVVEVGAVLVFAPLVAWNFRRWRENRAAYEAWRREKKEETDR